MKQYGLIGYPLGHSFSKDYFNQKFVRESITAHYENFEIPNIHALSEILQNNPNLQGFNVTIPYKQQIIPLLDALDPTAEDIGAVNTVTMQQGKLTGYNTDVIGFTESLSPLLQPIHTKALILGTGGASKAVAYGLTALSIPYTYVSRQASSNYIAYADVTPELLADYQIIINTTPLGTHPQVDTCPPIPYSALTHTHLLYDLVYNPTQTLFLKKGREAGATIKNGYEMLIRQAEAAYHIWTASR